MVSPLVMAVPLAIVSSHTYVMRDRYLWWVLSLFSLAPSAFPSPSMPNSHYSCRSRNGKKMREGEATENATPAHVFFFFLFTSTSQEFEGIKKPVDFHDYMYQMKLNKLSRRRLFFTIFCTTRGKTCKKGRLNHKRKSDNGDISFFFTFVVNK